MGGWRYEAQNLEGYCQGIARNEPHSPPSLSCGEKDLGVSMTVSIDELSFRLDKFKKVGAGWQACCPAHADSTPSLSIAEGDNGTILMKCHAGCDITDICAAIDIKPADLCVTKARPEITETYDYTDEKGVLLYQVCRFIPKDFRQRRPDPAKPGQWIWSMQGQERVLYNLPAVISTINEGRVVFLVEGEKDANALIGLGLTATCNPGGAGKWPSEFTEVLTGAKVIIIADKDKVGREHAEKICGYLATTTESVRVIELPDRNGAAVKDAYDWVSAGGTKDELRQIAKGVPKVRVPSTGVVTVKTIYELEEAYTEYASADLSRGLDLGKFIMPLRQYVRPLVPGELVGIIADTGVGKSAFAQAIGYHARPLNVLNFSLELPGTLCFERYAAMHSNEYQHMIERAYRAGGSVDLEQLDHIYTCEESRLTSDQMREMIETINPRPDVVIADYIGLMESSHGNKDRYSRVSDSAEDLKVLAKDTKTVCVLVSQIRRTQGAEDHGHEVHLHDAKNSGSIEASCGLLIGLWRDTEDRNKLYVKVLKNTKGQAGDIIECEYDGGRMQIRARSLAADFDDIADSAITAEAAETDRSARG